MFTTKMFKKIVRVLMKSDSIHEMKKEKTKMKIVVEKKNISEQPAIRLKTGYVLICVIVP